MSKYYKYKSIDGFLNYDEVVQFVEYKNGKYVFITWEDVYVKVEDDKFHSSFIPSGVQDINWKLGEYKKSLKRKQEAEIDKRIENFNNWSNKYMNEQVIKQSMQNTPNKAPFVAKPENTTVSDNFTFKYDYLPTTGDSTKKVESHESPKYYIHGKIQPIEYINDNTLGFCEGNVVKYITRHKYKNGAEDIKKAIEYCKYILKYQYGEKI